MKGVYCLHAVKQESFVALTDISSMLLFVKMLHVFLTLWQ